MGFTCGNPRLNAQFDLSQETHTISRGQGADTKDCTFRLRFSPESCTRKGGRNFSATLELSLRSWALWADASRFRYAPTGSSKSHPHAKNTRGRFRDIPLSPTCPPYFWLGFAKMLSRLLVPLPGIPQRRGIPDRRNSAWVQNSAILLDYRPIVVTQCGGNLNSRRP